MHNVIPALMGTRHLGGTAVAQLPKAVLQKLVASVAMLVACPILIVVRTESMRASCWRLRSKAAHPLPVAPLR